VREAADAEKISRLARELGRVVPPGTRMYLTGGATAVLEGWRESTVDIDVRFEPGADAALERIRDPKEELSLNVELASPLDFLPPLPGWQERSYSSRSTISSHVKRNENTAAEAAEAVRLKRLREDARRPISVNLAETIALSHALLKMADSAQRR
jgi:hypothetical protein